MKSMNGFLRQMERKGYAVKTGDRLRGKSGTTYDLDVIVEKDGEERIILVKSKGREASIEIIQAFIIGIDLGAKPFYVTGVEVDAVGKRLLRDYKMSRLTA